MMGMGYREAQSIRTAGSEVPDGMLNGFDRGCSAGCVRLNHRYEHDLDGWMSLEDSRDVSNYR